MQVLTISELYVSITQLYCIFSRGNTQFESPVLTDMLQFRAVGARIREIPDHATFREKCVNTGLVRQTWGMSLFGPM